MVEELVLQLNFHKRGRKSLDLRIWTRPHEFRWRVLHLIPVRRTRRWPPEDMERRCGSSLPQLGELALSAGQPADASEPPLQIAILAALVLRQQF